MKIACHSPFVPPEWISAHGFQPRHIIPTESCAATITTSSGICPYARALAGTLVNECDIDAAILTTTCDQMRRLEEFIAAERRIPLFMMNVPSCRHNTAFKLYLSELERLSRFLQRLGGVAPEASVLKAAMLENETIRSKVTRPMLQNSSSYAAGTESAKGLHADTEGLNVALLGGPLLKEHISLFERIEQLGGRIVLDATQYGLRTRSAKFEPAALQENPLYHLAETYFSIPDAFRRPNEDLYQWLDEKLRKCNATGIIAVRYQWCDIWQAEIARFRERCDMPLLELDLGDGNHDAFQHTTGRLQAFMETMACRTRWRQR